LSKNIVTYINIKVVCINIRIKLQSKLIKKVLKKIKKFGVALATPCPIQIRPLESWDNKVALKGSQ